MAVFLKKQDLDTAPIDDLRFSKKHCDKLRNLLCAIAVFPAAVAMLFLAEAFLTGLLGSSYTPHHLFLMLCCFITGIVSIIFLVLFKEESKYFLHALISVIGYALLAVISSDVISIAVSFVMLIVTLPLKSLVLYNENLKTIKGYPYFNHHDEHRCFEGVSRIQALESFKNGGIVDADSFFESDINSLREKEEKKNIPDKTEWLR